MEARFDDFVANVVMATFQGGDEADKAIWTMLKSSEEWRSLSQKFLNEQLPSLMIAQKTTITGEDDGEGKEDDTKETSTDSMSFHAVGDVSWSPNPAIAFVKRSTGALSDASFASQIQIITLGSSTSSSQNKESSTAETTKTSSTDMLNLLLQFTQHTFAPLVRSTTTRDQRGVNAYAELKKKIAELELALTQCKQNLDVPIVNLEFDAHITKVSQKCYDSDKKLSLEQLLLSEKCEDTQFLNMLQMSVSRWTKEIRKVTALTDRRGEIDSALREVKFWHSLEKSLNNIETQKSSYEFQITFDVLRQGKRYRPVMAFEGDTGLTKANALVENVMLLMRDFPIDDLLAATDVTQIKRAVEKIFRHLSRLKKANMYGYERAYELVSALSRDLARKCINLLKQQRVATLPYEDFRQLYRQYNDLFEKLDTLVSRFQDQHYKHRRTDVHKMTTRLNMKDMTELRKRLEALYLKREDHERLRRALKQVSAEDSTLVGGTQTMRDLKTAYSEFMAEDIFDMKSGNREWGRICDSYRKRVERIESGIARRLQERLGAAKNSEDMFRVFSKFNALFFRNRIRVAIKQFQESLVSQVGRDISDLRKRFMQRYNGSEDAKMTAIRDIPPVSGQIIWARQIERQLRSYLNRVEDVLGDNWEHHVLGKELKAIGDSFLKKLSTEHIFERWFEEINKKLTDRNAKFEFDLSYPILRVAESDTRNRLAVLNSSSSNIDRGDEGKEEITPSLELRVRFDPQASQLFKELRSLSLLHFGQRVPFSINEVAMEARHKYPLAMQLQDSLRTFRKVSLLLDRNTIVKPLLSSLVARVQSKLREAFTKRLTWDHEDLEKYSEMLSEMVLDLRSKVRNTIDMNAELNELCNKLESCEFDSEPFQENLDAMQKIIDDMNLASLSNLQEWVRVLDSRVETTLLSRLSGALIQWSSAFNMLTTKIVVKNSTTRRSRQAVQKKKKKDISIPDLARALGLNIQDNSNGTGIELIPAPVHEIVVRNGVLQLSPPLKNAKAYWIKCFQNHGSKILNLKRLESSRYDEFQNDSITTTTTTTYANLWSHLDMSVLDNMLETISSEMSRVSQYVRVWLEYQALWDMDASSVYTRLGSDVVSWHDLLVDQYRSRATFDTSQTSRRFGAVTIDYRAVQEKVNLKYDAWHKDLLYRFGDTLGEQMRNFQKEIKSLRQQLEKQHLDRSTAELVSVVTLIQSARRAMPERKKQIESYMSGERLLERQRFSFPTEWLWCASLEGEFDALNQIFERKSAAISSEIPALQAKILAEDRSLESRISTLTTDWKENKPLQGDLRPSDALDTIAIVEGRMSRIEEEFKRVCAAKRALELEVNDESKLDTIKEEISGLKNVWSSIGTVWDRLDEIKDTPWSAIVPRKMRRDLDELLKQLREMPNSVRQYEAFESVQNLIKKIKKGMSVIVELKMEAMKDRHWRQVLKILKIASSLSQLTIGQLLDAGLFSKERSLRDIFRTAQGEMGLESFLAEIKEYWGNFEVDLVNFQNKVRLVRGWDVMFEKLDEHVNQLNSMKQSPFFKVFAEESVSWEERLNRLRVLLDVWIDVQRRWVYLENIFYGSSDIKQLLPTEYARFKSIDSEFVALMRKVAYKPRVLDILALDLQRSLERLEELLSNIQRALGEYLERQRSQFSRFYFVGDEDLLEMIGSSKNPGNVQRHLLKMFAGIQTVDIIGSENGKLDDEAYIKSMVSREGEVVTLLPGVKFKDNPKLYEWLGATELSMQRTLAMLLQNAVTEILKSDRQNVDASTFVSWVDRFPTQIVILAQQVVWSQEVDTSLRKRGQGEKMLISIRSRIEALLADLADRVLTDLKSDTRKKYEQLITDMVHQRDVTRSLVNKTIDDENDFEWLYQMRYNWRPKEADISKRLEIQVANARFQYGFEYLGVGNRLVQTPLTDRCYLTLTQALHMRLGGNPFGPAGTGKTESVKQLGAQLGRFVLVFNCDDTFDFQAMGRIFRGLCQVGAWGCFDEFNRLEERILSAVSQQILSIQTGLLRASKEIDLIGKSCRLHDDVGIFVTMNPTYAGRSNLPDNLKQLFRGIAMIKPDWELIAQVMLFSQGFRSAERLAGKMVLLFSLCDDQLSSQPHYDFGLRALKSVLVSAGTLKRRRTSEEETEVGETKNSNIEDLERDVLIGSVTETMVPKLVRQDIALFSSILSGVFPGSEVKDFRDKILSEKISELCTKMSFDASESWVAKTMQLYQIQQIHHGVMMVGPTGSGKSSACDVLLKAMELVDGVKGRAYFIDPKAISKDELYGKLDSTTLEWRDGVFTYLLRQILNNVRGEAQMRHWIVFDGDVDPEWAENLNSVLDDNKLLTLPSGERLSIPDNVRIMFEVEHLKYATLATVSRCGMVWFSEDTVEMYSILCRYLLLLEHDGRKSNRELRKQCAEILKSSFAPDALVLQCLGKALELWHCMEVTHGRLLTSWWTYLKRGVRLVEEYNENHIDFPLSLDRMRTFMERWNLMSIMWGFGGSMNYENRKALSAYVCKSTTIEIPSFNGDDESLLDYTVSLRNDSKWEKWSEQVPAVVLESRQVLSTNIVIPTIDTIRHRSALHAWLAEHKPLVLCGPPGSGKTMTLTATLQSLPECVLVSLNFSSATTPDLILKTFEQYCEYVKTPQGLVLRPSQVGKWLVVFCDEINLPAEDKYGTQIVITFLRQLTTRGGFWRSSGEWVRIERVQFVGACNPPTDPGRVPLSLRFLAHAPVLFVDYPAPVSLKQIYRSFAQGLLKLHPPLRSFEEPLTESIVSFYLKNQKRFSPETQPHYVYSPRELSRWIRALYEAMISTDHMSPEDFVRLWAHEALRLFHDRLVTSSERKWCQDALDETARDMFGSVDLDKALARPILFSTWMSKSYVSVSETELRKYVQARMRDFHEEELNVKLVVFDDVLDHVLRIDRVLRQPVGHLLLVGESGAGKTVLSRFVAWMNGLSVFQVKVSRRYTVENFDEDLRTLLKRAGCEGEKICFIFDESNVLSSAFLERMNALLASGEVPGLFEQDEFSALMSACRESCRRDGVLIDTEEEMFKRFTREVQRNLHVVFTMNPASADFDDRTATSPALFNRCVVDWFGDWSDKVLSQVGYEFTENLDLNSGMDYDVTSKAQTFANDEEWLIRRNSIGSGDEEEKLSLDCTKHVAIVGSMVQIHTSVKQLVDTIARQRDQRPYVSPRDYIDFIQHYVKLFNEKRSELEEQQRHLNIGLDKIRSTEEHVAKLRVTLESKDKELAAKNVEANEKLRQMLEDKNVAEKKKEDSERLGKELEERDAKIAERRKIVDADLAKAEPALLEAQASVKSIRKNHLTELSGMARPPINVRRTMEAVAVMIGAAKKDADWKDIRKVASRTDFISNVVTFSTDKLNERVRLYIKKTYVDNDELTYATALRGSKAAGPLYKWVESQILFAEILNNVKPLKMEAEKLESEASEVRAEYDSIIKTVKSLETRIAKLKEEYAELIAQTEAIKQEMKDVKRKVERSTNLLRSLSQESERWQNTSSTFRDQVSTLAGDTLRAAAFVAYSGWFGFQQRKYLHQRWLEILEDFGISQRDEISFVEYLSKPNERLEWKANSLPDDVLCQENAVIMTRFNRFPLVIDPSGQATEFLLSQFKSRRMNKTSFVDPSFLKTLESALRFGTGLIVQDVENIDPILNPVLNREVQITGGRRLVRVGDQEIDFSPSFAMFMTTRDPSHQFSPDLCSRVTFSNFTVTSASLEAQCLSRVLRSKRPDIDEKRKTLLKLQGEYQARLRDLEDSLLNALSVAKGNILDDDNVMIKLETLKKEASEVQKEVQRTGEIMKEVEEISNVYKEFSKACSKIYFGMKRLSELHFLYHFSLNFFNDIVSHVLSTVKEDSVKILLEALFLTSYRRVSQGLLVRDHLVFALFLARVRLNLSDGNEDDVKKLHSVLESKNLGKTRDFVHKVFGDHFLDQSVTLSTFVSEVSNSRSPLLLCSTKGFDASTYVTRLATETKARLTSVSMGSAEGYTMADKSIDKAVSSGNWVMLRNVHLCPSWLKKLEKRLYTMSPRDSFRLFLTAEINISIPANLARISQVKVFEAPNGIKASLRRTLGAISEDRMNRTPAERSRLYFLLAWFHAVVLERRRFCPVGWTKSYAFGDSDQKCSLDVIDYWIDRCASGKTHVDPSKIPWQAIQTVLAETMYGGRIDNRFDDMVLSSLVKRLFVTESFDFNFELCKDVKAPEGTTKSHFVKWVESLPTSNPPEWLGLPSSAEARLLEIQARHLISCYAKLRDEEEDEDEEKRDTENTDVTSWMRRACEFAKPWLNKLPNLSPLSRDSGSIDSPVFRCLNREVELGIALLETVREDLSSVCNAIQESAKISNRCRSVMRDLSKGMLPSLWRKSTFSSSHIVTPEPWISDLVRRVNQLVEFGKTTNWISNSIWLGGLASPEAFLTATRQEAAKSKQCSLQDLHLSLSLGSGEGFSFKGLILEGAGWDGSVLVLSDKTSTVLPSVRFTWTKTKPDVPSGTIALEVPSYLNASRDEVIFTVTFYAKADQPEHVWRQRGVAMICWSS